MDRNDGAEALVRENTHPIFWSPQWLELFASPRQHATVAALVTDGDHGCGDFQIERWGRRADLAKAVSIHGLKALAIGAFDDAQRAFETALALDPSHTLARYNLACTFARRGGAAACAEALRPLLDGTGSKVAASAARKKWLALIAKDKDFDGVRGSEALRAVLDSAAPN